MLLTTMPPAYFPSLEFFWNAAQCDILILTDHFQFTKRSALTISAPLQLSQPSLRIPVRHGNPAATISEKQIAPGSNWAKKHLHTIRHMFHHAPYAYIYLPQIEAALLNRQSGLSEFLTTTLTLILNLLHLKTKIFRSSELAHAGSNEQLISNWCGKFNCNQYLCAQSAIDQNYIRPELLQKNEIVCNNFIPFPDYHILSSNRDLSVLFFLFHYGPEAGYLLRQYLPLK